MTLAKPILKHTKPLKKFYGIVIASDNDAVDFFEIGYFHTREEAINKVQVVMTLRGHSNVHVLSERQRQQLLEYI